MPVLKVKQDGVWKEIITGASSGSNIELDQTLTIEGMAADAKAVGDAIDGVITQIYDAGSIDIDLNGSDFSEPNPINADTLGGYPATDYVKHDDVVFGDGDLSVELDNSVEGDINPVNADTLGGISADEFAKLSDLENVSAGMTMELLWENASPTSEFAKQTINIDLSQYQGVIIQISSYISQDSCLSQFVKIGQKCELYVSRRWNGCRMAQVTTSGIEFDNAYIFSTYGDNASSINDKWCPPIRIYGIKE